MIGRRVLQEHGTTRQARFFSWVQVGYAMSAVLRYSRWSVVAPFRGDGRIEGSKKALAGKVRIP